MPHESRSRSDRTWHDGLGRRRTAGRERAQGADLAHRPQRRHGGARQEIRTDLGLRRGDRRHRFHPLDPAAGRRGGAGAALRAGADGEQQQAGLRRVQRGEPADHRAGRRRDRADRLAVRRRRDHRLTAENGRRRTALLRLRPACAALCDLAAIRARRAGARGAAERGLGGEDVVCRHHQGHASARRSDDAGREPRRLRRCAVQGARIRASRRCWPGSSAAWG